MIQQQHLLRPLMMPSTPGQQQQPNFPPYQQSQFMSPQQQHPPVLLQQQPQPNGPPSDGGMNMPPYQTWNPNQLPPVHGREQAGYPGMMVTPLLPAVFSPHSGGGPSGHDFHVPPQQYPPASMDTLCMS